jgi:hypothetical protein
LALQNVENSHTLPWDKFSSYLRQYFNKIEYIAKIPQFAVGQIRLFYPQIDLITSKIGVFGVKTTNFRAL